MKKKNIFVIKLNAFRSATLEGLNYANTCVFHDFLSEEAEQYIPVLQLLKIAEKQLANFKGRIDGILNLLEYPYSMMLPYLCQKFDVPYASSRSVIQCEHKYWSRLEQRASIPEHIPSFFIFDPYDDAACASLDLSYPFWIKPIKSYTSYLAFKIESQEDFDDALVIIRERINDFSEDFDVFLKFLSLDLPSELRHVPAATCLAESVLAGRQCTLEGCFKDDVFYCYGVVDSICYPNASSFFSYHYPSIIPEVVQEEMACIGERFLRHIGFNNAPFNIEFFWDEATNTVKLLEVNPRCAMDHSDLFRKVHGVSHEQAPLNIALDYPLVVQGSYETFRVAAHFFYRVFDDAYVEDVPDMDDIEAIEAIMPRGTTIEMCVDPDMYLSEGHLPDSYSYIVWQVRLGGDNRDELLEKYHTCLQHMNDKLKLRYCD